MKTISLKFAGCAALLALGLNAGAAINTQVDFNDAVAAAKAGEVIELESNGGSYKIPAIPVNITIKAADGVKFDCTGSGQIASIPNGATFKGGEFSFGQSSYHGFQHAGHIKMEGCTLDGLFFGYGPMTFTSCNFVQTTTDYNMWTYSASITYKDCTFNCNGKAVNVYWENHTTCPLIVSDGCTFISGKDNKPAFKINSNFGPFLVAITDNNTIQSGFARGIVGYDSDPGEGDNAYWVTKAEFDANGKIIGGLANRQFPELVAAYLGEGCTMTDNGDGTWKINGPSKEIEIKPVTKDEAKGITQDVADEINNNTEVKKIVQSGVNDALANIDPAGEAVVKVNLEKVEKATDEAETPTLTFEVAPYVGDTKVENVNEKLNGKKVTVVLPLTKAFTVSAIVTHEDDLDRLLPVLGLPDNPYVRLETTHFSEFSATPSNQRVSSTEVDAKTVLGIKRVKEMSKSVDTAAAVPWMGAAGGDCKVSELITTGLAVGDTIKVYDLTTKGYFIWVVDKDGKTWVKVSDAPASQPEANEYTLARGRAFWYMKDGGNESDEYTQIGTYSTDQILTTIDKGVSFAAPVHNLLINPKWTAFNIQEKLTAAVGCAKDDVVVIVETGKRYRFDGTTWGQDVSKQTTDRFGRTITTTVFEAIGTGDGVVSAGTAFWYLSAGGVPTIAW